MGLMTSLTFGGLYGWTTSWVIAGVVVFVVVAPIFLWIERRQPEPLLDLDLFRDRLFTMGNLTGLLNGIARNGVLFLLVFYLQGARGYDPVMAGILLSPLAIGLLVLSPISGILSDRYGSRELATAGMIVTAIGLAGLLTLSIDTPYWQLALWQLIIGAGSGLFASPNTSAVMGVVPPAKRGIGSGTRMMLAQTGFIVSIALAIGLVTSAMDPTVLVSIFSGTQVGGAGIDMDPFIGALHLAFGAGVVASLVGAAVSMMRGGHRTWTDGSATRPAAG
jgi:MFS family permease